MFGFGTTEVILVAALLILFFGAKKVSELAKNVGEAIGYIKDGFVDNKTDKKDN